MRYLYVAPKNQYYIFLIIHVVIQFMIGFIFLVFREVLFSFTMFPLLIICLLEAFYFILVILKSIYVKIDKEKESVIYGNAFFRQETELKKLQLLSKVYLIKNQYKVKIDDKVFYLVIDPYNSLEMKQILESLPTEDRMK